MGLALDSSNSMLYVSDRHLVSVIYINWAHDDYTVALVCGTNETTSEIVTRIIIPESAANGCCYASLFPGEPKQPTTLMSHWWGNRFVDLVKVVMRCC